MKKINCLFAVTFFSTGLFTEKPLLYSNITSKYCIDCITFIVLNNLKKLRITLCGIIRPYIDAYCISHKTYYYTPSVHVSVRVVLRKPEKTRPNAQKLTQFESMFSSL